MKKRLKALKNDQSGFTLVELIVVLVILAILAALLVPALMGYIDRARTSKYLEEVRSITTAMQAINDENYAKGHGALPSPLNATSDATDKNIDKINELVFPAVLEEATFTYKTANGTIGKNIAAYTIDQVTDIKFKSQDGTEQHASFDTTSKEWTVSPQTTTNSAGGGQNAGGNQNGG